MGSILVAVGALKLAGTMGHAVVVHAGDVTIYRFDVGTILLSAFACLALGFCALLLATAKIGVLRTGAVFPAALALLLAVASIDAFRSHVTVGPQYLEVPQKGLWHRVHSQLKYDELNAVIHDPNTRALQFIRKTGGNITVPRGDLTTAAMPAIADALRQHNVSFVELDQSAEAGK
ncbi:MAG TPA: hypothetical protein VL282_15810 [Tepidisphaeraceae bacterium]|nr:hypothetical protein [Tepidisphaeraceae bacterium]